MPIGGTLGRVVVGDDLPNVGMIWADFVLVMVIPHTVFSIGVGTRHNASYATPGRGLSCGLYMRDGGKQKGQQHQCTEDRVVMLPSTWKFPQSMCSHGSPSQNNPSICLKINE